MRALSLVALLFGLRVFLDAVTQGKVQDRERRLQRARNITSSLRPQWVLIPSIIAGMKDLGLGVGGKERPRRVDIMLSK